MSHPAEHRPATPAPDDGDWVPGGNPWVLVWTIVGAKLATIVVIVVFSWSMETGGFILVTQWHWLPVIAALVAAPATFAIRLRRARRKREALRRSEWVIAEMDLPQPAASRGDRR